MRDSFNFLLELLFLAGAPFRNMEARWADGARCAVLAVLFFAGLGCKVVIFSARHLPLCGVLSPNNLDENSQSGRHRAT